MRCRWSFVPLLAVSACSQASLFNFEPGPAQSGLTTLSQSDGGLTITITRSSGLDFDVQYIGQAWTGFGDYSLSPFAHSGADDYFVGNFSSAVDFVSLYGADGGNDPDTLELFAYSGLNGTGSLLGSAMTYYGTLGVPDSVSVEVSAPSIRSVLFRGGSGTGWNYHNSLYIDNIVANPMPEPAHAFALGLIGLAAIRRRSTKQR